MRIVKEVLYMGRKNVIIPTDIIVGNFFRIKEEQKTKEGRQRYSISLMSPEKKMLHQKGVKVRIRAAGKEDPKVYEAAEKLIRKNSKIVVEWIKEGSLPQAPSMLLLHIIAEESVQKAYGIGEERKPFLIEALQNLPPLKELEGTADADTLRVVDAVAHTKEDKIGLKRALNIIYDGAVKCGIWKENISSKVLVTARSTTEKADKNLKTRIFTLEELRKLTQSCIEHMDKEALYAALLLQLTTGVKVGELCGLNLSSVWKYEELRVLKIDGKMTQKRGEEAEWRLYDREYGKLRFIPCTYLAQTAVRTLFKARLETGAGIHAPLIVEGKSGRLTPERYKKFVDKVLESVIPEYSKTSRTDLIRASFEGYCRNICGMDIGQVQKILGLQAQQTYEQWYVDYGSRLALLRIEAQLERCHKLLVSDGENLTDRVYLRWRKKRGEQMIIKDKYGVKIDIL